MEKPLHICMVVLHYHPFVGGAETRTAKQARQLQAQGHHVLVVTSRHLTSLQKTEVIDGIPVVRVGGSFNRTGRLRVGRVGYLPNMLLVALQLWRLRQRYDILHSMQISPLSAAVALISKLTGKPFIISIPSTGPASKPEPENAHLMLDTLEASQNNKQILQVDYGDMIVGDTMHMKKTALGGSFILYALKKSSAIYHILSQRTYGYMIRNGFRADRIVHIPGSIDVARYKPAPAMRPSPTQAERDILCVARLQYPKGVDVLLHAWKRMLSTPDDWRAHLKLRLLIAGTGDLEKQMRWLTRQLGIEESVVFLGSRSDVIPLLQKSWGFVLPSRWEGMPNALLEAMGCGIPCIATRVSGSEDIIEDGINGLLVEPEDPGQLAQALQRLLSDTTLAQHMAHAGRTTVVRDYQLAHITQQFETLYRNMLNQDTPQLLPSVSPLTSLERVGE